ncbi:uncharacterized protein sS8_1770 [Methylocaldum marinum]|uniref:DUF748 domain-containing protein n=1 Tax=Methylocaldum marinum TaxID=1432792 RepID=A0A250KQ58_9GAMM|nr:DUF748 domain-containing protein [Methylocaldum marinum]BBA33727.1 uncharacterized protein sS8_1770 [Methylocaldum marinum]
MNRLARIARNPWILTITAALLVYTLAGFSLIPYLVRHYVPKLASQHLKRDASVGEVGFNPFVFTFEARDFDLKDTDGQPILRFSRLFIDFELESIFRRAWTFADFRLETPSVNAIVDQDGTLNLARIAEDVPKSEQPEQPDEPLPRLLIKHLSLTNGSAHYADYSKDTDITETVSPIDLELRTLTTLPEKTGDYQLVLKLPDGATLEWRGNLSLNPMLSDGDLRLDAFSLATPWRFLRDRLGLDEPSGRADLSAHYRYSRNSENTDLSVSNLALKLSELRLAMTGADDPILAMERIEAGNVGFDLAGRNISVPSLVIENGEVRASVDSSGSLNWQNLVKPEEPGGASSNSNDPPPDSASQTPWKLVVENFKTTDVEVAYTDASRRSPYVVSINRFGFGLKADAEIGTDETKARIEALAASLDRIALTEPGSPEPLAAWDAFEITDGQVDLEKREAIVGRAALKGGKAKIIRDKSGTIHLAEIFGPKNGSAVAPSSTEAGSRPAEQAWNFALKAFALEGFSLALVDRSLAPEIAYDFKDINIDLQNITNDNITPVTFDAALKIEQGGSLKTTGTASLKGDRAEAKVEADRINLTALHPLVSEFAKLKLESGDLSSALQVEFTQTERGPSVKTKGTLSVSDLLLNEAGSSGRFLSWKKLSADEIDFSLAPDRLSIREVRIDQPGSKITIFEDRSTNLAAVFKKPAASSAPDRKASTSRTATRQNSQKPFPVTVERVRVSNGVVDFSDLSLVIPFAALIHDFNGTVTDISTVASGRTHLAFAGRVNQFGSVNVDGAMNLMEQKKFSDIDVVFRNVSMTSLSPYSATFAGRKIQSGKLDLDLEYKIEDSLLKSENKIALENFTLGDRIESPNAVSLPLDLAVAVLTDSQGQINVSVPVEGDVDSPKFRYGKVVWEAVVTVLQNAATAPFRMIGSVFGDGEEHLDTVLFEPGGDTLPPPELEKIKKFGEALEKRPILKLTVHGQFDPERDGEALRSLSVRRAVSEKVGIEIKAGEDPGPLAFTNAKTQRALEELIIERAGPKALDEIQANFEKKSGRKPQRLGRLSALFGRASEDQEFYEQLFKHLVGNAPLEKSELEALGERRANAIRHELIALPGVDRTHIGAGKVESTSENIDGKVPSRLKPEALGG